MTAHPIILTVTQSLAGRVTVPFLRPTVTLLDNLTWSRLRWVVPVTAGDGDTGTIATAMVT